MSETNGAEPASDNASKGDSALQQKNDQLYGQLVDLKKQLESYTKLGNIDDLKGRLDSFEQLRKETAKTPEEINRLIADKESEFERRYSGKFTEYETKNQELTGKLKQLQVIVPTMNKAAALFNDLELVQMLIEKDLASDDDGNIFVKGKDGKPEISKKDPRKSMDVDEYLEALAEKHKGLAKPRTIGTGKEAASTEQGNSYKGALPTAEELLRMSPEEIKSKGLTADHFKTILG